jgi:hypothetical protein
MLDYIMVPTMKHKQYTTRNTSRSTARNTARNITQHSTQHHAASLSVTQHHASLSISRSYQPSSTIPQQHA